MTLCSHLQYLKGSFSAGCPSSPQDDTTQTVLNVTAKLKIEPDPVVDLKSVRVDERVSVSAHTEN